MPPEPKFDDATPEFEPLRRLHAALTIARLSNAARADEAAEFCHPDITILSVPGVAPGPGFRGRSGFRRYFGAAAAHGFQAQGAITEAHVTDAGNVLASGRLLSIVDGVPHGVPAWFVYRFRDGLVSAIETYLDWHTACDQADGPPTLEIAVDEPPGPETVSAR
jgi:ketosteroid isomerase-like protein